MAVFEGYRRPDGRVGVRNHVVVINATGEAGPLVRRVAAAVPGAVAVTHTHGRSQFPEDREQTFRTLVGNAANPNVYAALFVGVGGPDDWTDELVAAVRARGTPCEGLTVQGSRSLTELIDRATERLSALLREAGEVKRSPADTGDLIVGLECGGSDGWSGVTANPAVGKASDLIVAAGGTVILSETPEAIGAEHILVRQAASPEVAADFMRILTAYEARMKETGDDYRAGNPSPGNKRGGLTTLDEKSLGCIKKGGSTPLMEVVPYAVRPTRKGFVFMDSPGYDVDSVTGMVAGGAQVVFFTTGRGSPTGSPIAPVIKVSTNSRLYRHMPHHIDVDAGGILEGRETLDDVGARLFAVLHEVAGGALAAAERQGHREFNIWRLAETM